MEELVWCFAGSWMIVVIGYFLWRIVCSVKDFLIGIFRNNGTE